MRRHRNPFRTEAEAFQLLLLTVVAFAAVGLASWLGGWEAGLPVWIVASAGAAWYYLRPLPQEPHTIASKETPPDEHRVLVVANETVAGRRLHETVRRATSGRTAQVLVVSPALNSPLRHFVSDEDEARRAAQARLDRSLKALGDAGIAARGEIGDADPLQAIEDSLRTFGADEIIIATHPEGRSNWLEKGVVTGAQRRFTVPITHVVVDLEAEAAEAGRSAE